jgi:hypothetical protein
MLVDRPFGDPENLADFPRRFSSRHPGQHFEFAGGERAGFTIRCECFDDLPGALSSRDRHIVSMRHVEHVNPAAGPE